MFGIKKKSPKIALLLGGGGARAAYQVGVLKAIAEIVPKDSPNPFPIVCGTSAGSINAAAIASNATDFHAGVTKINAVWSNFKLNLVFYSSSQRLFRRISSWLWSNIGWGSHTQGPSSLLDNSPLKKLLSHYINLQRIDAAIDEGHLHAFCITACSYTSGESTTFFDGVSNIEGWQRTHRTGRREKITIDHLMASSAIPVIFPAVNINGEYYGDGSMRQSSPISPALHLGAEKILIIGLRTENKMPPPKSSPSTPSLAQISGYILDTLFLNSLFSDIERLDRINDTLDDFNKDNSNQLRKIDHLLISPSEDIATIATKHFERLPKSFRRALNLLGMQQGNSRRFISYLMFIKSFCTELIDLGYADGMRQKEQIKAFLELN